MIEGKNGCIFENEDIESLLEALKILIKNKELRNKFWNSSKEIIKNYSINNMVYSHLNIFNRLDIN